jgi:hypothetical protein
MLKSSSSSFARVRACALVSAGVILASSMAFAQAGGAAGTDTLLVQARRAAAEHRFDAAMDRYYALLLEQAGTPDAQTARLELARLLALTGSLPSALLQCQALRDELPSDHPARERAGELATLLARRLRAGLGGRSYYSTFEAAPGRGIQSLDEPRTLVFEGESRYVLVDDGARRVFRVGPDTAGVVSAGTEPTAAAVLPDGSIAVASKTGLTRIPSGGAVVLSGTWGGKTRQLKKVRSMAALSTGELLVVDRDFEGLLRCQPATGACQPWGPAGKHRTVRVGDFDWVYLLDDRGQGVRVFDTALRPITLVGPTLGGVKLEKVEDLAVDSAHGLYLLDTDLKQVHLVVMRAGPDGRVTPLSLGAALMPREGDRALKNPTTIGVSPSGSAYVTGKSSPRVMRFR